MERRGRIPVAKFRTQEAKSRSRSRVREPDYNEQDPETDLFTLLEDNIALKEENKTLKAEIDTMKKSQDDWQADKSRIELQLKELKAQQSIQEAQIREFTNKCIKLNNERNALDKLHKMKVDIIESLKKDVEMLQDKNKIIKPTDATLMLTSDDILSKLIKVLPTLHIGNELESLVEVDNPTSIPLTVELMERLIDEFLVTKSTLSSVELQLYEANEKLSELLEHQQHLQEDNEALRTENEKLTKVAKLLTDNMRESVETSQKMEAALLSLKKRNDELVAKLQDQTDGNSKTVEKDVKSDDVEKLLADENQVEAIQQAVEIQNRDHGERIVEMKNLIDAAIEKTTNAELKTLQVKLEILEADLRQAIERAENAEKELEKYKSKTIVSPTPPPPPPPPPPLPPKPFSIATKSNIKSLCDLHNLHISENIRSNGGNEKGNRIIGTVKQQVNQEITTGVDALVQELKSGRVTLRRRQRRSVNTNDALQEMFQVLEISQKQNRNSKICMDLEM